MKKQLSFISMKTFTAIAFILAISAIFYACTKPKENEPEAVTVKDPIVKAFTLSPEFKRNVEKLILTVPLITQQQKLIV